MNCFTFEKIVDLHSCRLGKISKETHHILDVEWSRKFIVPLLILLFLSILENNCFQFHFELQKTEDSEFDKSLFLQLFFFSLEQTKRVFAKLILSSPQSKVIQKNKTLNKNEKQTSLRATKDLKNLFILRGCC